ncbi:hypothetical protein DFJ73DRAFT_809656 [Zopfochytrium polystomum]|nr:hypothetical protein DFJ73DRAFT_809656 [Zopfochytrium polystomum]
MPDAAGRSQDILGGIPLPNCPFNTTAIVVPIPPVPVYAHPFILHFPVVSVSFIAAGLSCATLVVFILTRLNSLSVLNRRISHASIKNWLWAWVFALFAISYLGDGTRYALNLPAAKSVDSRSFSDAEADDLQGAIVHRKVVNDWIVLSVACSRVLAVSMLALALHHHRTYASAGMSKELPVSFLPTRLYGSFSNRLPQRLGSSSSPGYQQVYENARRPSGMPRLSSSPAARSPATDASIIEEANEREPVSIMGWVGQELSKLMASTIFWIFLVALLKLLSLYLLVNPPQFLCRHNCPPPSWIPPVLLQPLDYTPPDSLELVFVTAHVLQCLPALWLGLLIAFPRRAAAAEDAERAPLIGGAVATPAAGTAAAAAASPRNPPRPAPAGMLSPPPPPPSSSLSRISPGPTAQSRLVLVVALLAVQLAVIDPSLLARAVGLFVKINDSAEICAVPPWWWIDIVESVSLPLAHGWASLVDLLVWVGFAGALLLYHFVKQEYKRNSEVCAAPIPGFVNPKLCFSIYLQEWILLTVSQVQDTFFSTR